MSLKAKLEAVIYAAEEPVTLAQLAFLFAAEALEWKAEQEAAVSAAEQAGEGATATEPLPLLNDAFSYLEIDPAAEAVQPELPAEETTDEADSEPVAKQTDESATEPSPPASESGTEPSAEPNPADDAAAVSDPEAEARRQARQRDREIKAILRQLLDELVADYAADGRGIEIREIAGGYRMATKPEFHDAVRGFVRSLKPALKLSLPALETLAVVAYKQPVTAPEVNEIRGVDSSGVFGSLLSRKLIATAGRKQVVGRPILYKTTREFLLRFGLKDVSELPSMEEFEKMAAMELEEPEMAGGQETAAGSGPELDETAPEDGAEEPAGGAESSAEPSIDPSIELSIEPSNHSEPGSESEAPAATPSAAPEETEPQRHD